MDLASSGSVTVIARMASTFSGITMASVVDLVGNESLPAGDGQGVSPTATSQRSARGRPRSWVISITELGASTPSSARTSTMRGPPAGTQHLLAIDLPGRLDHGEVDVGQVEGCP